MSVTRKYLVHAIAVCCDCGWDCEAYRTAQCQAARHAKSKGHRVEIELGYVAEYRPSAKPGGSVRT